MGFEPGSLGSLCRCPQALNLYVIGFKIDLVYQETTRGAEFIATVFPFSLLYIKVFFVHVSCIIMNIILLLNTKDHNGIKLQVPFRVIRLALTSYCRPTVYISDVSKDPCSYFGTSSC